MHEKYQPSKLSIVIINIINDTISIEKTNDFSIDHIG